MTIVLVSPTLDAAGRDYSSVDAYLDSQALLFYDGEGAVKRTDTLQLRPARQDTGQNPNETRPEAGDIFSQGDFTGGLGQHFFHRSNASPNKYLWSESIDISKQGEATLLNDATQNTNVTTGSADMVVFNSRVFITSGASVLQTTDITSTWTTEAPDAGEAGTPTVNDFAVSGSTLYVALGSNGIHARTTAGVYTHYSDVLANGIEWIKDRLIAWSDSTRAIYEVTAGGAAPAPLETLAPDWRFVNVFEGGSFIYAIAIHSNSQLCRIYHYGLNTAGTALEKKGSTPVPTDIVLQSGVGYLGQVFLGGHTTQLNTAQLPVLFRAIPDTAGFLNYEKLFEGEYTGNSQVPIVAILPLGDSVLFGLSLGTGATYDASRSGVGIYNLATGALSTHLLGTTTAGNVTDIVFFKGRICWMQNAQFFYETPGTYETSGSLITSAADWNNAGLKTWSRIEIAHKPMPNGASIAVYYTSRHPKENAWTLAGTSSILNSEGKVFDLDNIDSRVAALKFVLTRSTAGTAAPTLLNFSFRSDPSLSQAQYRLIRTVEIAGKSAKGRTAQTIYQNPREVRDYVRSRHLEWLDWHEADTSYYVRLIDISETKAVTNYAQTAGDARREEFRMTLVMEGRVA